MVFMGVHSCALRVSSAADAQVLPATPEAPAAVTGVDQLHYELLMARIASSARARTAGWIVTPHLAFVVNLDATTCGQHSVSILGRVGDISPDTSDMIGPRGLSEKRRTPWLT